MRTKLLTISTVLTGLAGTLGVIAAAIPVDPTAVVRLTGTAGVLVTTAVGLFIISLALPKGEK